MHAEIATYTPLKLNDQTLSLQYCNMRVSIMLFKIIITSEQAAQIMSAKTIISNKNLNEESSGGKSEEEKQSGLWVSYAVGILIYFLFHILIYDYNRDCLRKRLTCNGNAFSECQTSYPFKAKIAGVLLLALTQMGIIAVVFLVYAKFVKNGVIWDAATSIVKELSLGYVIYAILFLLLTIVSI
ncbi:hypothetical protein [Lysinibacillus pakistanensis]|uniref:hypothetical protein n=1 Tax=Lysinibacillus pakistanensis TaxID=759811 RepID=UPI003D2C95EE